MQNSLLPPGLAGWDYGMQRQQQGSQNALAQLATVMQLQDQMETSPLKRELLGAQVKNALNPQEWKVTERFNEQTGKKEKVLINLKNPTQVLPFGGQEASQLNFQNTGDRIVGLDPYTGDQRTPGLTVNMRPGEAARLDWDKYQWNNLSPFQRQQLINEGSRIGIERTNSFFNTGMNPMGGGGLPQIPAPFAGPQAPAMPPSAPIQTPQRAPQPGNPIVPQAGLPVAPQVPAPQPLPGLSPRAQAEIETARQKTIAEARAKAEVELPSVLSKTDYTISLIDKMIGTEGKKLKGGEKAVPPHPGFEDFVGATWKPGARFIPGTNAANFQALYEQLTGGAFLQAFESLKGGGQITEIEGEKGTKAITRMTSAQSESEFIEAAREFQSVMRTAKENAIKKAGKATTETPAVAPEAIPQSRGWSIRPLN